MEEALDEVAGALAEAEQSGNAFWNAHLLKLQGDYMLALSVSSDEAEACYRRAIATAQHQGSKSLELRATTSLCRLWQRQGKSGEAYALLSAIYGWFTEGFDTVDLREANTLSTRSRTSEAPHINAAPAPFPGVAGTNIYCYNVVMKAAFAILANLEAYNFVRKLAWNLHFQYHTGTIDARLPPHVSLKQPFAISDLDALEQYMHELAQGIEPFEVELTKLELRSITHQGRDYGLLWIAVQENPTLRALHNQLNLELSKRFGDAPADFDGGEYLFHMTIMMGGQATDVYRAAFAQIAYKEANLRYTARHLAMFVYDEPLGPHGEYLTYKILPIGTPTTAAW